MPLFTTPLGGAPVAIYAPDEAEFDPAGFTVAFPPGALYGLDVESGAVDFDGQAQFAPNFMLRLVQFATLDYAWVLDMQDHRQRDAAYALLANQRTWFCSHTDMDVVAVNVEFGVDITARNVDTWIFAKMAKAERADEHGLKALTTEFIGPELEAAEEVLAARFLELWVAQGGKRNGGKEKITRHGWDNIGQREEIYLTYAGLDAIACRRLAGILPVHTGAPRPLLETEVWLAGAANRIKLRGLRVDTALLTAEHTEAKAATDDAEAVIIEHTELPAGSIKIKDWLGEHGVDWGTWPGERTANGNPSLGKENINLLGDYPLDEVGKVVVDAMITRQHHLNALRTTQGVLDRLVGDRIHPTLHSIGTITARMSSNAPNTQNISKSDPAMRGMFLPDPGHILMTADFDQIELRVAAAFAGEQSMIDTVRAGEDLHQLTADKIGCARDLAKTVNFLILYGGGAGKLASQTDLTLAEAKEVIGKFWSEYPEITKLNKRLKQNKTFVRTVSGRLIPVPWFDGEAASHKNLNYLVQSSARECLVHSWWHFAHDFGRGDYVWFPVHDEIVMQVPEDQVDAVRADIEASMTFDFMSVPIAATAVVLRDEHGTSRWMTSKRAEQLAAA